MHERDIDTDFSLLLVRKLLRLNSRHTKVVLMSATFDSTVFANYFSVPLMRQMVASPIVEVEGKPFKVHDFYAEDILQLGPVSKDSPLGKLMCKCVEFISQDIYKAFLCS